MTSVATFHVFPGHRLLEFREALAPRVHEVKSKGLFFTRTVSVREDSRREFLEQAATEVSSFDGPGFAFSFLDRLLERRGLADLFANMDLAERTTSLAIFDQARAKDLVDQLTRLKLTRTDVEAFAISVAGTRDARVIGDIFSALRQLIAWLKEVPPDSVGVLMVEARPDP